jgi:transcriptional regulator with XRE-family HTH domain
MVSIAIGRMLRMVRIRQRLRQADVATRANLSQATIARHEAGVIRSLDALERHAAVLGLRMDVRLRGLRADLSRLADDEHAAIVELLASGFQAAGWLTELEASYNDRGERGRIDILAYHPATRLLLIVEVKTELADLQDLFGSLNAKVRQARSLARVRAWPVARVVSVMAVASTHANREVVRLHPASFRNWTQHAFRPGWPAQASTTPDATLLWVAARASGRSSWLAGRRRVREPVSDPTGARTPDTIP